MVPWWPFSMPLKMLSNFYECSPPIDTLTISFIEDKDENSEATETGSKPIRALWARCSVYTEIRM